MQGPVIVPRPLGITSGPFSTLPATFDSEVLLQILFYSEVSGATPSSGEAILDQHITPCNASVGGTTRCIQSPYRDKIVRERQEFRRYALRA